MSIALQAQKLRWSTHGMAGIDSDALRAAFKIPAEFAIQMVFAIGRRAEPDLLPEPLRQREFASTRRPISELAAEGEFPGIAAP
jgi:hypothetical protein